MIVLLPVLVACVGGGFNVDVVLVCLRRLFLLLFLLLMLMVVLLPL
jgi:hypothetical protein